MKKNFVYNLLCGIGGGFVGYFAVHLKEPVGIVMFAIGVFFITYSCIKLSK